MGKMLKENNFLPLYRHTHIIIMISIVISFAYVAYMAMIQPQLLLASLNQ